MFGLGKNDNNQRAAVEKFKNAMVPLHGGYIFRLKRDGATVLLTEAQRDILLDFYAALLSRSMRQMVGVLIVGVALLVGAGTVWHFGMHFWAVMILILIAFAPILAINRQMRAKVQEFGTLPIVPSNQVAALSRERLRKMPWATLFAPPWGACSTCECDLIFRLAMPTIGPRS